MRQLTRAQTFCKKISFVGCSFYVQREDKSRGYVVHFNCIILWMQRMKVEIPFITFSINVFLSACAFEVIIYVRGLIVAFSWRIKEYCKFFFLPIFKMFHAFFSVQTFFLCNHPNCYGFSAAHNFFMCTNSSKIQTYNSVQVFFWILPLPYNTYLN